MSDTTAIHILRNYQRQLDVDGWEVGVSRQALDEVLDEIERLQSDIVKIERNADYHADVNDELVGQVGRLRDALERIVAIDDNYHSSLAIHKALEIAEEALKDE